MKFLGSKLKELRNAKELTMVQLEELSGVKQSALSQYESGKKNPLHETASKLATALGVDLYYFYMEEAILPKTNLKGSELPDSTKKFLNDGKSVPYIILGEKAKEAGISPDFLITIIEAWEKSKEGK